MKSFIETQRKLQAAVEKFAKDYESSSSEDELETENLIGSLIKTYSKSGGEVKHLKRTQAYIEDFLRSGSTSCLICIGSIKRIDEIWSCTSCYCLFHLQCIQNWSNDSTIQRKEAFREQQQEGAPTIKIFWSCPKCRYEYTEEQIPKKYRCFCQKVLYPKYEPWLVPHSCGEKCGKKLTPLCEHECLITCHPGPCPPCPVTVSSPCHCGKKPPIKVRCSERKWSCLAPCQKPLCCGKHRCFLPCHEGSCKACKKTSEQNCDCGTAKTVRNCDSPNWQCTKVCQTLLSCGFHTCPRGCHKPPCGDCERAKPRTCPCEKTTFTLPCTEDVPTCGDTCGKLLECGTHTCHQRCHKGSCGTCLDIVVKWCRCGQHKKEVQCQKQYFCETKCKNIRTCNRHPCNRKCCDGICPPCEKPCGRTLTCGNHKCTSVCHRGPCYPCVLTEEVKCRCGETVITVPCGRKKRTRPPRCTELCKIPPICHHPAREPHQCHFGDCPPCRQICMKKLAACSHKCPALCHTKVLVKVEGQKGSMPWEQIGPYTERRNLPCPDCLVPIPVTCLGEHETSDFPCYLAKPSSCQRLCGRQLECENHSCELACHVVEDAPGDGLAGKNCSVCEGGCTKTRPEGCTHPCPLPCHSGECPPCKNILRFKCHCGLNQQYVWCSDWNSAGDREQLQSCNSQCPRNFDCGHRCRSNCHSGPCPNAEMCKKKVKITCPCRRIRKEFPCDMVRRNEAKVECDSICLKKKEEEAIQKQTQLEAKQREEELKNAKEVEQFQKKFLGKRKNRDRKKYDDVEEVSMFRRYWYIILAFVVLLISLLYYMSELFV